MRLRSLQRHRILVSVLCALVGSAQSFAQTVPDYQDTPSFYEFVPNAFSDVPSLFKKANPADQWPAYLGLAAASALLIRYDQDIVDRSQAFATKHDIISEHDSGTRSRLVARKKVGPMNADLRLPKGPNSYMYFIGDGLTSLGIIGGLAAFGGIASDKRALNTSSQLAEGVLLTGMIVITSKFTFGRESPNKASKPSGVWRPMPGKKYLTHVSTFDAFPSGHVATATTMVTLLHLNYVEKVWILPVGIVAIGALMFSMLNNGVHWAGDFPVGAAIGVVSAKTVFDARKPPEPISDKPAAEQSTSIDMKPFATSEGLGLAFSLKAPKYGFY